ncbi:30S ribosomal subunit S4 [Diplocarpon rosae]|nr:30S ribosomal subunit S4 [Diplocarpon rosae]
MARKRFHGLKRVKIRASWNKYNLYNLTRLRPPNTSYLTFYQQKWAAKSMTRAYHGEQIREKQWQRMFTPHLNSVVPMNERYLAEKDGSELAAGRGSGLEKPIDASLEKRRAPNVIPYMNMTYAPIERRLDMAIFRALFASSARQARQFVTHGKVRVNGKKMPYPGYLLNPGDMFQVEPESVLYATGAPKDLDQQRKGRQLRRSSTRVNITMEKFRAQNRERREANRASKAAKDAETEAAGEIMTLSRRSQNRKNLDDNMELRRQRLADATELLKQADKRNNDRQRPLSAKQKQVMRALVKKVRIFRSNVFKLSVDKMEKQRTEILEVWKEARTHPQQAARSERSAQRRAERKAEELRLNPKSPKSDVSDEPKRTYREKVIEHLREEAKARMEKIKQEYHDPTKPYATPWRPRPYMSAFAFVPRYLEVSHNICSAVYLRHPVARAGSTEVPTPFPAEMQQLAFTWYLRRR